MHKIPSKQNKAQLAIPVLGLGTWMMGGRVEHNPDNDDDRDIEAIRYAIAQGITHIDTAEIYADGHAEKLVSEALHGHDRKTLQLATKVSGQNLAYDHVLAACERSLKRLQTDYIDLYYIHIRNKAFPLQDTARALNALVRDGRVRHVGVCNFNVTSMEELQTYLEAPIAANQSHYSLVYREPESAGLLEHCQKVGTTFVAWRPVLWRDPTRTGQPQASAWETRVFPILDELSAKYGATNMQTAVNWLINQPNICTLVKCAQPHHLDEILQSLTWELRAEDIEHLRTDFPDQRDVSCAVPLG